MYGVHSDLVIDVDRPNKISRRQQTASSAATWRNGRVVFLTHSLHYVKT